MHTHTHICAHIVIRHRHQTDTHTHYSCTCTHHTTHSGNCDKITTWISLKQTVLTCWVEKLMTLPARYCFRLEITCKNLEPMCKPWKSQDINICMSKTDSPSHVHMQEFRAQQEGGVVTDKVKGTRGGGIWLLFMGLFTKNLDKTSIILNQSHTYTIITLLCPSVLKYISRQTGPSVSSKKWHALQWHNTIIADRT